jgi:hypothetical protein
MTRALTVDYEEVHLVLAAASLAVGSLRRSLLATLPKEEQTPDASTFAFFITQIAECKGMAFPFERLTANPGLEKLQEGVAAYMQIDEALNELIVTALTALRRPPEIAEKKA